MSEFYTLLYVLFHLLFVLNGNFVVKRNIEVLTENIIGKVEASLTQCHLKCKLNNECIGYGTLKNTPIGQITDCYLIRSDQRNFSTNTDRDEALAMYVIEMDGGIDINLEKTPLKVAYVVKEGYCYHKCGEKYGPCEDYCGENNFCCKKGYPGCEDELRDMAPDGSRCVAWRGVTTVAPTEVFNSPAERVNTKNNLLTTIPKLSSSYTVKFDFKPTQFQRKWTNVHHLTATGNRCCDIGDRVPGVWFRESHSGATTNRLHISSAINGDGNYQLNSGSIVPLNEWTTVIIMQRPEGAYYRYTVKVRDVVIGSVINRQAREYTNVKVFGADSWYDAAQGIMRNLVINPAEN